MKILTAILAVYVLLLTSISCADALESSINEHSIVKAISDNDFDCCDDACSPFCSCTCCVGFTNAVLHLSDKLFIAEIIETKTHYIPVSYSSISTPPFQPPRA